MEITVAPKRAPSSPDSPPPSFRRKTPEPDREPPADTLPPSFKTDAPVHAPPSETVDILEVDGLEMVRVPTSSGVEMQAAWRYMVVGTGGHAISWLHFDRAPA
jgi:hypothetical protein